MIRPARLKVGDRVFNGSLKGVVFYVDRENEKVQLVWDSVGGVDYLSFASPLWISLSSERQP